MAQSPALSTPLPLSGSPPSTTPRLVYGTAWKKSRTSDLVHTALASGFRGIDTAAQPQHYDEPAVGLGLRRAVTDGIVSRSAIFLQTKFSPGAGASDPSVRPFDPDAPLEDRVHASVASSLRNLATPDCDPYIDSMVMHSPMDTPAATARAWKVLESYVPAKIHRLGISNVSLGELRLLYEEAKVKPAVVQNRFYARTEYETGLRAFCRERDIVFQTFWTLSGNPQLLKSRAVARLSAEAAVGKEVALYALVLGLGGTTVLDGTTDQAHMVEDLTGIEKVGSWAEGDGKEAWKSCLDEFKASIGEV